MNPKAPTLDEAKSAAISCFNLARAIPSCHILSGVMEPRTPCFDPSDEIMKSHRPVHSGGGTVLDTEGTTILRFRLTTREQTTSTGEN